MAEAPNFLQDPNFLQQILNHCLLFSVYPAGQTKKDESHRVHQAITAGPRILRHHYSQIISSQNSFSPTGIRTIRVFIHYGLTKRIPYRTSPNVVPKQSQILATIPLTAT